MWLIYFLSILNNVCILITVVAVISGVASLVFVILSIIGVCQDPNGRDALNQQTITFSNKARKISLAVFIPALFFAIIVPNSRQAAMIFGVGTTIDYVRNNDKILELPDKAVDCLDKYINEYLSEDNMDKSSSNH
jgi:hypothetical protein